MKNMHHCIVLLLFIVTSCSSVEGLRDKSYTLGNQSIQAASIETLTILPIKDDSPISGLSEGIEMELSKAFQIQLPKTKIVSADAFRSHMAENELINEYTQWRSAFDQTRILSVRPLKKWSQISGTRYFLMITKVHLSREKMKAIDTGYSGWVNDAENVWRTDLKVFAQIIDTESGAATWKGVGHAEKVYSPKRIGHSDSLIVWNEKNPETDQYIGSMIKMAVDGLVTNIAPAAGKGSNSR